MTTAFSRGDTVQAADTLRCGIHKSRDSNSYGTARGLRF